MPVSMARVFRRGVSPVFKGGGIPSCQARWYPRFQGVSPVYKRDGIPGFQGRGYPQFTSERVSPVSRGRVMPGIPGFQGKGYPQFTSEGVSPVSRRGYPQFTSEGISPVYRGYPWFPREGVSPVYKRRVSPVSQRAISLLDNYGWTISKCIVDETRRFF